MNSGFMGGSLKLKGVKSITQIAKKAIAKQPVEDKEHKKSKKDKKKHKKHRHRSSSSSSESESEKPKKVTVMVPTDSEEK